MVDDVSEILPSDIYREIIGNTILSLSLDNCLVMAAFGQAIVGFDKVAIALRALHCNGWLVFHKGDIIVGDKLEVYVRPEGDWLLSWQRVDFKVHQEL